LESAATSDCRLECVVERPFVLDFAGAYLDNDAPWFEDEMWEMWEADKREKFGTRWREVQALLAVPWRTTGFTCWM
jgi:hypothetical protein